MQQWYTIVGNVIISNLHFHHESWCDGYQVGHLEELPHWGCCQLHQAGLDPPVPSNPPVVHVPLGPELLTKTKLFQTYLYANCVMF